MTSGKYPDVIFLNYNYIEQSMADPDTPEMPETAAAASALETAEPVVAAVASPEDGVPPAFIAALIAAACAAASSRVFILSKEYWESGVLSSTYSSTWRLR